MGLAYCGFQEIEDSDGLRLTVACIANWQHRMVTVLGNGRHAGAEQAQAAAGEVGLMARGTGRSEQRRWGLVARGKRLEVLWRRSGNS